MANVKANRRCRAPGGCMARLFFNWQVEKRIHFGTSGWVYKHWKGLVYPEKLPSTRWLLHYTNIFSATEINGCFYRLPSIETVERWVNDVPEDFYFCPKISRFLTHMKKLRDPEEPLERFFSVFHPMQPKMGPVLVQLPQQVRFNYEVADHFYRQLKFSYGKYSFVMEVRHESWLQEESLTLMTKYDIGFVISHSGGFFPYLEMITAMDIYLRFHGPAELYASSYSEEMLRPFAEKILEWESEGHRIWVFFNNDIHGYAVEDARKLENMVKEMK